MEVPIKSEFCDPSNQSKSKGENQSESLNNDHKRATMKYSSCCLALPLFCLLCLLVFCVSIRLKETQFITSSGEITTTESDSQTPASVPARANDWLLFSSSINSMTKFQADEEGEKDDEIYSDDSRELEDGILPSDPIKSFKTTIYQEEVGHESKQKHRRNSSLETVLSRRRRVALLAESKWNQINC